MMEEETLKAYQSDNMRAALTAIELAAAIKEKYAESWIVDLIGVTRRTALVRTNAGELRHISQPVRRGCIEIARWARVTQRYARSRQQGESRLLAGIQTHLLHFP